MRAILISIGLALYSLVSATTYYVSPTGNNSNPGTINSPWATWGQAFNSTAVRPGDIVYFRGGVYPMTSDNLSYPYDAGCGYNVSRDGTLGNYIYYFAYPGETPILDCGNITPAGRNSRAILGNDMNYVHFKGLTVRNVRQTSSAVNVYGWVIEGNNLIVEDCTVHNCGGRGFFSNGHEIHYLNCDSHHNSDQLSASLPGNDGVGFQNVDLTNADGSIYYKNCRAWMNGDQGFSAVSIGYLEFDGCWSFNNGQLQGEGHGFKMGSVGTQETQPTFGPLKRKYTNCVAAYNRANGWTTNEGGGYYGHRMQVYNNTAYHNGYPTSYAGVSYGFLVYNTLSIDSEEITRTYRNNISYNNQHGVTFIASGAIYTHSNNTWDTGGLTISDSDFISVDSTGITAPRLADGSLPDNNCYRNFIKLAPGSDLIDKGVDVGLPFGGVAPDLGAFESSSGPVTPVSPVYISSAIENATPARLELTYNLALASTLPAASAFAVRVNTVTRTVSSVAISGTKVLLTLSSPVVYGDVVTVAYTKPATNPLQTATGGQAVSIFAQNVTNNVVAVSYPVYVSSVVENATPARLELTYNLSLASIVPAASAFTVIVNSVARTVSSVAISGTKVLLTLASPVVYGDVVTVAYTKPATNPLQTAAGGQAVSISAQNVTNNVGAVVPAYVSSVIENATPARLELTYNLSLASIVPAASAFTVIVNSVARTVSSVAISGTKVLLTLSSPVASGNTVTFAYTKPATNPLQTTAGAQAISITARSVTNNVAAVSYPVYVSSVVENATPARLELTYNLTLAGNLPAASAFAVRVNTVTRTVSSVAVSGTKVLLTLASPVVYGDVVTVAYTKPATNPLQTAAGGQAASISAQNVTNNVVAELYPVYVSSVVENATPARLELTYSLSLASIVPATSAFTVIVNSVARTVSAVSVSGTKVLLTLSSPVGYGNTVTVAYTRPSANSLQTPTEARAASFSARIVTNNVGATNQPPTVTISSPVKSTSFISPATITIDATASDPDGTVVKVEFYQGTVKLGEISSAPYSYTWKEVPEGTYSITAAATDNQNMRTVSAAVSVVVEKAATGINEEPVVVITLPTGRPRRYKKDDRIVLIAEASDPDGSISKVEFKNGDVTLAEVTTSPYSYTWQPADTGTFVITAIATDNLGATSAPSDLELNVSLPYDGNSEFINLYPNPNDGHFVIELSSRLPDNTNRVTIVNLVGKIVYDGILEENEYTKSIDISGSPSGNYILVITDSQNIVTTKKFIKN